MTIVSKDFARLSTGDWRAIKSCAQTGVATKPNKADKPNVLIIFFKVIYSLISVYEYKSNWINTEYPICCSYVVEQYKRPTKNFKNVAKISNFF